MELGFGLFHLTPNAFWSMTPRELQAGLDGACAVDPAEPVPPLTRAELTALRKKYPDNGAMNG